MGKITEHTEYIAILVMLIFYFYTVPEYLLPIIIGIYASSLYMDLYSTYEHKQHLKYESNYLLNKLRKKFSNRRAVSLNIVIEVSVLVLFAALISIVLQADLIYWIMPVFLSMGLVHLFCWRSNSTFKGTYIL